MFIGPGPKRHPFWSQPCPDRPGPGLTHAPSDGNEGPCAECGITPEEAIVTDAATQQRLAALGSQPVGKSHGPHVFQPTITGLCLRCRQSQAGGNHPAGVGTPPIMEPRLAKGEYRVWQFTQKVGYDYVEGDPDGPGRGQPSKQWKSWARIALTPIDSEYR